MVGPWIFVVFSVGWPFSLLWSHLAKRGGPPLDCTGGPPLRPLRMAGLSPPSGNGSSWFNVPPPLGFLWLGLALFCWWGTLVSSPCGNSQQPHHPLFHGVPPPHPFDDRTTPPIGRGGLQVVPFISFSAAVVPDLAVCLLRFWLVLIFYSMWVGGLSSVPPPVSSPFPT